MEALVVSAGVAAGGDWRRLALVAGAVWAPLPFAVAVAAVAIVGRRAEARSRSGSDVRFAESVVGELRAGGSLRSALRAACAELPSASRMVRRLDVGEPLAVAIQGLGALPSIGGLVETAVEVGGGGGRMLPVFEELMVHAAAEDAARAELRIALAPVRASMVVLAGAPLLYLMWSLASGRMARLLARPGGMWLTAVGGVLFLAGVAAMLLLAGRKR